jgi:Sec-independent protein translocase protein TatA
MKNQTSFGEWFIIVVSFILLIGVLLRIGTIVEAVESVNQMKTLYYQAISGTGWNY